MAKLYLIRRKLESFVGPMTAEELQKSFERMDFGIEDEVVGHCGKWIKFENKKSLQKYYPDVFPLIYKGSREVWSAAINSNQAVSFEEEKIQTSSKKKRKQRSPHNKQSAKKSKSKGLAYLFLLMSAAAIGLAVYLIKEDNLVVNIPMFSNKVSLTKVKKYFQDGNLVGFMSYMKDHQPAIVTEIKKNKIDGHKSVWLPYLRFYAYQGSGEVAGLPASTLKGRNAVSAPSDCSMEAWTKNWKSSKSQWADMVYGKNLVKSQAGRMLGWDPHWIKRRPSQGWSEPINYYGACVFMAYRAFEKLMNDKKFVKDFISTDPDAALVMEVVRGRIGWISYIANGTNTFNGIIPGNTGEGFLAPSYWTCLEAAGSYKELDSCKQGYQSADQDWKVFEKDRLSNNLIRLTFAEKKKIPTSILMKLGESQSKIKRNDPFTRFDFRAEIKYLDLLLRFKGDSTKSLKIIKSEYPEVLFH
jgi:hypothetical protein